MALPHTQNFEIQYSQRKFTSLLIFVLPLVLSLLIIHGTNRLKPSLVTESSIVKKLGKPSGSNNTSFTNLIKVDSAQRNTSLENQSELVSDNLSPVLDAIPRSAGDAQYKVLVNGDKHHLIGAGMVNVTDNENGYLVTFLTQDVSNNLGIAFDPLKIPQGYTIHDVYSYRFDETSNNWEQLKRVGIDYEENKVHSITSKDGEFINAVIKVPEAPETKGYAPTTLNDIKVGDPASMVQIIQPPVANNQGTANLSYHIETHPGRGGIEPDLDVTYSSDGGNGWMGEGWSLSGISSITVDTRWGVPKYDPNLETETYLLDGQMLADSVTGKTAHRFIDIPRSSGKTAFTERKQRNFSLIQRYGTAPEKYYWVITDKSGTKYFYGWDRDFVENALIRKNSGNVGIAEWKLTRVQDVWGNYMNITYNSDYPHPEKIEYARHGGNELSFHRVIFKYSEESRVDDTMINALYGVAVNPNARRLDEIVVQRVLDHEGNNVELVRKYGLTYKSGAFGKTLLARLTQYSHDGSQFNFHEFGYFNEDQREPFYKKAEAVLVNDKGLEGNVPNPINITNNRTTAIGASKSSSNSTSIYFGIGSGSPTSVNISGGIQYNNSSSSSEGINTLIDIDGDGLPDKVFVKDGKLQYEKNLSVGPVIRFESQSVVIEQSDKFLEESSRTTGWGAMANFGMSISYQKASTETIVKTYFSDVNGDGLVDIVRDGTVLFNTGRRVGHTLHFSPFSSETPALVDGGTGSSSLSLPNLETHTEELVGNNPLQEVVRFWEAPFDGVVDIEAPVQLVEPSKSECKDPDGVWVAVEHKNGDKTIQIKENDYAVHPISLPNLTVKKGDLIFFRVQPGRNDEANGECDRVMWSPKISYTQSPVLGMDTIFKQPAVKRYTFQSSQDFLVSSPLTTEIPEGITSIQFSGTFKKGKTMDTVTVEVVQLVKDINKPIKDKNGDEIVDDEGRKIYDFSFEKVLFSKSYGPDDTTSVYPISNEIDIAPKDRKIQCIVSSKVNIDLIDFVWHPEISYYKKLTLTAFDDNNVAIPGKDTLLREFSYPLPYYVFNDSLRFANARYDSSVTNSVLDFYPLLRTDKSKLNSKYWFAVKTADKVLGRKLLTYENGILKDGNPISVPVKQGDPYIVSFEGVESQIGKLNDTAYQNEIKKINNTEYYFKTSRIRAHFLKTPVTKPHKSGFFEALSKDGTYRIVPELSVKNDSTEGSVVIQVWVNAKKLTFHDQDTIISYKHNAFSYASNHLVLNNLKANDTVSVQFVYANDTLNKNPELQSEFRLDRLIPAEFWVSRINKHFGPMYKGWGQFIYNGMNGRASLKIDPTLLRLSDDTGITGAHTEQFKGSLNSAYESEIDPAKDENYNRFSAINVAFSPMLPYGSKNGPYWLGGEDMIFLKPNFVSTSRLGIDDVKPFKPFDVQNTFANGLDNSFGRAFAKASKSTNSTFTSGAAFLTVPKTKGSVYQILDFLDVNGDRFPDVVTNALSQLTNVKGSLVDSKNLGFNYFSEHRSSGFAIGGTSGASSSSQVISTNGNRQSSAPLTNSGEGVAANRSAALSIGAINGAHIVSGDNTNNSWIDINGDGLPDKVSSNVSVYGLNLGNGEFQVVHLQDIGSINNTKSLSQPPGISPSFSIDKNSFSGGAGISFSGSRANENIQDINGDRLPDIIDIGEKGELTVAINTGKNFIKYPSWLNISEGGDSYGILADAASFPVGFLPRNPITTPWFDMERTKFNSSNGVSLGGSFTFGFSLLFIKLVFSPSFHHSRSIGRTIRQIIDVNADGYPDILYSTSEKKMEVWLSNLGRTNKLSEVKNPLGGEMSIDYGHTDVTERNPGGKWAMTAVTLRDGVEVDRIAKNATFDSKKTFSYSGGRYDRYEREFLGFGKTVSTDLEFDENNGKPYREVVRKYETDTYFGAGQLLEELLRDAQDTSKIYTVTQNEYYHEVIKNVEENNGGVGKFKRQVGVVFPLLKYTINGTYEGGATVLWQNKSTYFYEQAKNKQYGYISRFAYKESPKDESDESITYQTKVSYEPDDIEHYLIGRPTDVITQSPDGSTTYRHDGAEYFKWAGDVVDGLNFNGKRKLKRKINYLKSNVKAITEYQYSSSFGTISRIVRPDGVKIKYEYDKDVTVSKPTESRTESLITGVINETRGLTSRTFYDYRYGIPVRTADINENWINYTLDRFGRIIRVVGPKECGNAPEGICQSGKSTIQVHYSLRGDGTLPSGKNPIAKAGQYMEDSDGNSTSPLETINFIDGFNRSVQVKKTADVVDEAIAKWTVSGRANYDALGRVLESYYPALDNSNGFAFIEKPADEYVTKFTYDQLDRKTTTILPRKGNMNGELFESIVFGKDHQNVIMTTFSANDGFGGTQKREQHFDGSGLLAKEVLYDNSGIANITQFLYDPVHRLERVIDAGGRITETGYDHQGNKTMVNHPDAGSTRLDYDSAGRLFRKVTGNGDSIEYKYDHDRLVQIKYPRHPENNILYVYSDDPKRRNSANKVIYQEDASGAQSFEYGELGEIITNTRTIIVPFSSKNYTFTTKFKYDTWNRLLSVTYPDQETIRYGYNRAGLLSSIKGKKDPNFQGSVKKDIDYITEINYDRFDQRVQVVSNAKKVTTTFNYEVDRRRLALMKIGGISSSSDYFNSFESSYAYDNQNNVRRNVISKKKGAATSTMVHTYGYDKLNRLDSAGGTWLNTAELATYNLGLSYDGMFSINTKNLTLEAKKTSSPQATVSKIQYVNNYLYGDVSSHLLTQMTEVITKEKTPKYNESNTEKYYYDENGNNILKATADKSGNDNVYERKIDWDEENRINAVSVNGYVSQYVYDADGERTIKLSTVEDAVFVNGKFAGDTSSIVSFSLYANPYFSMRNGNGVYSKHIYIGNQRIVSQIENTNAFKLENNIPLNTTSVLCPFPTHGSCSTSRTLAAMRDSLNSRMNAVFTRFDFHHETIKPSAFDLPPAFTYGNSSNPLLPTSGGKSDPKVSDQNPEWLNYYYHTNQIGSTSFITDNDARVVQYVEYLPFGETFMEQRQNYSSQFLFNGKEQDQETGLYYYGARYYDTQTYQWLGADPMADKYPGLSPYNFVLANPVRMVDPDGNSPTLISGAIGILAGGVISGSIEAFSQYRSGGINDWKSVYAEAAKGSISGGIAGLTAGGSLLTSIGVGAIANVSGGVVNNAIRGKDLQTSLTSDAVTGAVIGGATFGLGSVLQNATKSAGVGNPFKGKTFNQIDEMFTAKGFTTKGVDPLNGKGSYFNPQTGTKYYLDKGGMYKKGFESPHVDVWYKNHPSFEKVKYFLDGTPKQYTPKITE